MPKAEFGTTKWMSNKIKASGLQKLRWYCQMCQKQCRDENGFKCHRMSEGHQRMMQVFIEDPNKFMDEFSRDFEREFMRLMRTRYCRTRVLANSVYNNIVADRQHIHMNATIWVTLSEFVQDLENCYFLLRAFQYLGSTNKCKIELTPKGWYVEYIDHEELKRLEELQRRRKEELSQEEAKLKRMEELVEEAERKGKFQRPVYTPLQRKEGEKIVIRKFKRSANEGSESVPERPVNALKLLEAKMKTEQSREKKRALPFICIEGAAPVCARGKTKDLSDVGSDESVSSAVGGNIYGRFQEQSLAEAHCDESSAASAFYVGNASQRSTNSNVMNSSTQPASKQRRLLAMERLRIEEERKKQRAAWLETSVGRDEQAVQSGTSLTGAGKLAECSQLLPFAARATGIEAATEAREVKEDAGVEDGHQRFRDRPPSRPPPHKYKDKDWWLSRGLIVKVLHKTLGEGQFYSRKGRVLKVEGRYGGYVQMLDSGAVLRLDQKDLETVIPNIGGWIRVSLGAWRDHEGIIEGVDVDKYCVHVVLKSGPLFKSLPSARPFLLKDLPYEHVCKVEKEADLSA